MMAKKTTLNNQQAKASPAHNDLEGERKSLIALIDGDILAPEETERLLESYDEKQYQAIEFALEIRNKMQKHKRRKSWDKTLLRLVVIGFIASYCMILFIGFGWLKFENNSFAVPSVVAAGIIQTYGLAKIAAEYFFSDDKTKRKKK